MSDRTGSRTPPPRATIGVVIPAYNAERYLLEAARSVLRQSFADLELLIVDDGSTDGTLDVARSLRDERVRVLTGPNRGRAHARNTGIAAASPSELIALLDADDVWDADKLETQVEYLARHPDMLAVGSFMRYVSSTGRALGETGQTIGPEDHARIARCELVPFPVASCLLARRSAVERVGGFDDSLWEAEDIEFLTKLARCGAIGCVPSVLGSYRIHPASAMACNRFRVNMYARFIRARFAARDAGGDLTWDDYSATYGPCWRERRLDLVEFWYRSAALWHGEGHPVKALSYGMLAALAAPRYTLRRLYRQRLSTPSAPR